MRTSLQDAFTSCVIVLKVRRKGCSLTRMASRFGGDWQTMGRRIIFRIIVVAFGMIAAFAVALIFFWLSVNSITWSSTCEDGSGVSKIPQP